MPPVQQKFLRASSKRRAAAVVVKPNKRPRADVHPIQKDFADRVPDEPGILVAPMGSGKPRMAGKFLDRIVSKRVAALEEGVPGVSPPPPRCGALVLFTL